MKTRLIKKYERRSERKAYRTRKRASDSHRRWVDSVTRSKLNEEIDRLWARAAHIIMRSVHSE